MLIASYISHTRHVVDRLQKMAEKAPAGIERDSLIAMAEQAEKLKETMMIAEEQGYLNTRASCC